MAKSESIPAPAVRRISFYLRQLESFLTRGDETISSRQLGEALGLSDAQVRKDLAYFGQFGHPGIGYRVTDLIERLRRILGTDKKSNVLLVGVGNLGRALIAYRGFSKQGFEVVAIFDRDSAKIGQEFFNPDRGVLSVRPPAEMPAVVRENGVRLGLLTVPADTAQSVAEEMVAAGIRGILNFAPVKLRVPREIWVSSVDLAVHLEQLSFLLGGANG